VLFEQYVQWLRDQGRTDEADQFNFQTLKERIVDPEFCTYDWSLDRWEADLEAMKIWNIFFGDDMENEVKH
jgi:hypothetical protein